MVGVFCAKASGAAKNVAAATSRKIVGVVIAHFYPAPTAVGPRRPEAESGRESPPAQSVLTASWSCPERLAERPRAVRATAPRTAVAVPRASSPRPYESAAHA